MHWWGSIKVHFLLNIPVRNIRSATARRKLPSVLSFISGQRKQRPASKMIVFGHHRCMMEGIAGWLRPGSFIQIDGSTPPALRFALTTKFQTDERYLQVHTPPLDRWHCSVQVAILSITAAGVGINLSKADVVIFAELYWNPGQLIQAEDRAHRIGVQSKVDVYYLLADGTIDDVIWPLVNSKLAVVGKSLNGAIDTSLLHVDKMILDPMHLDPMHLDPTLLDPVHLDPTLLDPTLHLELREPSNTIPKGKTHPTTSTGSQIKRSKPSPNTMPSPSPVPKPSSSVGPKPSSILSKQSFAVNPMFSGPSLSLQAFNTSSVNKALPVGSSMFQSACHKRTVAPSLDDHTMAKRQRLADALSTPPLNDHKLQDLCHHINHS